MLSPLHLVAKSLRIPRQSIGSLNRTCFSTSPIRLNKASNDPAENTIKNHSVSATPTVVGNSANLFQQRKDIPPGVVRLLEMYDKIPIERVRCFSIIAHIDHGKSTLADKLLELTGNIWPTSKGNQQVLDNLEVERSRGITVKAQSASMVYKDPSSGLDYLINLIDTPGHVDFSYEVVRSLAACQGALLLVDASQGVQAQTVANYNAAIENGLSVIPVLTKIDLPTADPEPSLIAIESAFNISQDNVLWTSAKTGEGIGEIFPALIKSVPPPGIDELKRSLPFRALLVDSWFDTYRGVVCSILVVEGSISPGDEIVSAHKGDKFFVQEIGLMAPSRHAVGSVNGGANALRGSLSAGQIGYMIAGMKNTKQATVGDTFCSINGTLSPLPGFRPAKPMVFASLYPVDTGDFQALVTAVERLTLNDASVSIERESSTSLGFGLRCGFLGLLHMDVFNQRLQSEFSTPVITTSPMVAYKLVLKDGTTKIVERPGDFPPDHLVKEYYEPTAHVSIMSPSIFVSSLMSLLAERRGIQEEIVYIGSGGGKSSLSAAEIAAVSLSSIPTAKRLDGGDAEVVEASPSSVDEINEDEENDEDEDDEDEDEDNDDDEDDETQFRSSSKHQTYSISPSSLSASDISDRVVIKYRVPWAEVVTSLNDRVKSLTAGYASLDWIQGEYQLSNICKVDILLNGKPVDALSFIAHKSKAQSEGRKVAKKLKENISRHQFEVIIQASIGTNIVARERLPPFRKDVLLRNGKVMGGGDVTRKKKLLEKQKTGKKRMKTVGSVRLSQEAFHSIMTTK
jgi:elongation factor 4